MTIEIDELVLQSLQKLKQKADERRLPLHQYLEQLADIAPPTAAQDISAEELEAAFDELDDEPDVAELLPPDFSRADIYCDHD
jgi:hypothetical protein